MSEAVREDSLFLLADVLVIGGGPAGTWAALAAAAKGASVVLADKGYCGSSGATAPSGTGVWYVKPDEKLREEAKASRYFMGGQLAEHRWMDRVLNRTYDNMNRLGVSGYPFPINEEGQQHRRGLQGPEYMRLMRKLVKRAGVKILDHSPAMELLADEYGVAGAAGVQTQSGKTWTVHAGAVVIATGGCAFLSKALGCNVLTGDGYLFAAEAGAALSGMEFSNAYAICPTFSSVTKTAYYNYASFYHEDGTIVEGAGSKKGRSVIARHLMAGRQVYARLDQAPEDLQPLLRVAQTNFFLPFDRLGINPFKELFPITLRLEGTVRGTGGIRVMDENCATGVPGLYAAGDAATRELICGGFTGGGSHNAAWAMSSGSFAGEGAAGYVLELGHNAAKRNPSGLSSAPLVQGQVKQGTAARTAEYVSAVQAEVKPYEVNLFRTEQGLSSALGRLDELWSIQRNIQVQRTPEGVKAREAAAMTATARWMYNSALARTESRGMHKREDYKESDTAQHHRLISGGLDQVWVKTEEVAKESVPL
ncbi:MULTISPECIES: FAD-dependent oxidoreductase [Paenibacillus]|uniref:FAD-dependent oxidoreductase n=1 Tax=Paenibacillus TaxID=44249 RepID=UPI0009A81CA1|nr:MULTISPECIES: FAD-binding protein [Paenibacillus]MCZ1265334.1 FAD-dependent oxidoreductase [Paenibacillus tundrae]WDQ34327.1 FAD-binding protein [Paenibacillus marchantiae]SLK18758.1 Succinate dehydrogenase/fumarate reductase, flavoprotein subunit [Paenibacillus sp. RU5A]SOC75397.1 Succinate dehydrogenase/fumarate reductase, flavoprotein subunit [Paenibacillus sp. RU26A]SOC77375.1 Succinate dehydrogenase/fumarate reductase, flavoprotein subunit [Paenibacillus sp. RU5M]